MAYIGNFDATHIAPATEMTALPNGEYLMAITESDMKSTRDNTGQYLQLTFTVLQSAVPDHVNRKVFVRLNLINASQSAVDIAQRELSAICHSVGVMKFQDSQQIHNLPMTCSVKYVPPKGEYAESNKISGYKPAAAFGKGKPALAAVPTPPRPVPPAASAAPAFAPPPVMPHPAVPPTAFTSAPPPAPFASAPPAAYAPPAAPAGVAPWRQAPAETAAQLAAQDIPF
jgi:hypothetical protein